MGVNRALSEVTKQILHGRGLDLVRASTPAEVSAALDYLRPLRTEHELIRLGSDGDAGYLLPADLDGIVRIYSPGVSDEWSFEDALVNRTGASVVMIDCNPVPENCTYDVTRGFLGGFNGPGRIGINEWLESVDSIEGDYVLQMDIEGGEYEVLMGISMENLRRFRIVLIEFHFLSRLSDSSWLKGLFRPVVEKLAVDFIPVHAHVNNVGGWRKVSSFQVPQLLEMTYLRRDRVRHLSGPTLLPHPLDRDNDLRISTMSAQTIWAP